MSPKKTTRPKPPAPIPDRSDPEPAAEQPATREDEVNIEVTYELESPPPVHHGARGKKKRTRPSKKEIPEYFWTSEATATLADLIKSHPELFDKRQKDWLNVPAKNVLWESIGQAFDPPASGNLFLNVYFFTNYIIFIIVVKVFICVFK